MTITQINLNTETWETREQKKLRRWPTSILGFDEKKKNTNSNTKFKNLFILKKKMRFEFTCEHLRFHWNDAANNQTNHRISLTFFVDISILDFFFCFKTNDKMKCRRNKPEPKQKHIQKHIQKQYSTISYPQIFAGLLSFRLHFNVSHRFMSTFHVKRGCRSRKKCFKFSVF